MSQVSYRCAYPTSNPAHILNKTYDIHPELQDILTILQRSFSIRFRRQNSDRNKLAIKCLTGYRQLPAQASRQSPASCPTPLLFLQHALHQRTSIIWPAITQQGLSGAMKELVAKGLRRPQSPGFSLPPRTDGPTTTNVLQKSTQTITAHEICYIPVRI